jgi:hypothetical protein
MGQDLRQLLPAYVRQEFDDMDIFLASTAKVHLLFPSLARYFLLARFRIFRITNTWRKKKKCFLRVASVVCDKTINANS